MTHARVAAAAALALVLAACQAEPPVEFAPPVLGVLHVTVHDEQDRPVPGATVFVAGPTDPITTDRNGIALLPVYAPVTRVVVQLRGWEDGVVESVKVASGTVVRVTLKRR